MNIKKEIKRVVEIMKEAAAIEIIPRFNQVDLDVKEAFAGGFKEYATEADLKASQRILKKVRPQFPGSYSEEEIYEDRFDHEYIWQFDPVDGTQEFGKGLTNSYAMHAALLHRTSQGYQPIAGVIYLPGTDKLWYTDEHGLHFIDQGLEKPLPELTRENIRGYVRRLDPNDRISSFYTNLGRKLNMHAITLASGGGGASISDLLEGTLNLIIMNYDYTKEWDLAMAEPIIKARGGFICDMSGNDFTYNRRENPPFNRNGYVISVVFKKQEIIPEIPEDLLIKKL